MHKDLGTGHPDLNSLALYHKYDEGTGDVTADQSLIGNDGTLIGALWLPSTVPFEGTFDLFDNEVRGVWAGQNEASSDIMTLTGSGIIGDQSIVFSNSDGGYDFINQIAPEYNLSLEKVWRVTTQGDLPPSLEVSIDISQLTLVQISEMFLLFDDTPDFSNATAVPGTFDTNTFTVPAGFFFDEFYYTLALKQTNLSAGEINNPAFDFEISPNPNNGQFQLTIQKADTDQLQFKLIDISGKMMFEKTIYPLQGEYSEAFDFGDLSKGVYLLQLNDGQSFSTRKVVLD